MAGAWTRAGLRAAGWDAAALQRAMRRGVLVRVGWDRYAEPGPLAVERLVAAPGSRTALRALSAARAWGLPVAAGPVQVVVPHGSRRPRLPAGIEVRQSRRWHAIVRDGVVVTDLARTLADVAREVPVAEAVLVLDAGLRRGVPREELQAALSGRGYGDVQARRSLELADPRAESPLESRLRLLLTLAGLPPADLQHEVREHGRFVGRVDLWYPGVVVEADGFAFHRERDDYRRDRRRGQACARLGLLLLRFSWEDVVGAPDAVVSTVRAALAASVQPERPNGRRRRANDGVAS